MLSSRRLEDREFERRFPRSYSSQSVQSQVSVRSHNSNYESSGTGNGARPRSQSAHSRSTMNREEEENLDYWERLRKKSTPIPVLQREMDYFMDTASHRIFGAKKNRLEEEFARRTPKLADLDLSDLDILTKDAAGDESKVKESTEINESKVRNTSSERPKSRTSSKPPLAERMDHLRTSSPLNKFLNVPMEALPILKESHTGLQNKFPNSEFVEASSRGKKVKTGTSFVDLEEDEKQYVNAFPNQSLQEWQEKRQKQQMLEDASKSVRSRRSSVSSQLERNPSDLARRNSVLQLRKLVGKVAMEEGLKSSSSQKMLRRSSVMSIQSGNQSSVIRPTANGSEKMLNSLETASMISDATSRNAVDFQINTVLEEEDIKLMRVADEKELNRVVKILEHDAGLVANWKTEFINHKQELKKNLTKKLDDRRVERDEGYHNRAIMSKVGDIVLQHHYDRNVQRQHGGLWKTAKQKLDHDRSAFPIRKAFYKELLDHIDQEGGLKSIEDERFLFAIKRRMESGFPISSRLIYDLAMEFGGDIIQETDYQYIVHFLCSRCNVSEDDLARYISAQGLKPSAKAGDEAESVHGSTTSEQQGTEDDSQGTISNAKAPGKHGASKGIGLAADSIMEQSAFLLPHLPCMYEDQL
eukprot:TRINITY_DN2341_c0_g1_i11.p1 TRINITY_DN2341_c0_g1~~TRINITY_DN2341_c0_g1_i11.p1  ORF type:complete len:642 (+),score=135.35 TRINITY_DN2341_c0_g1_i11:142-2067(+)